MVETEDDTKESSPDTLQDYVLSKVNDEKLYIVKDKKYSAARLNVLSKEEVKAEMDKLIKSKAVFVVGKSYCPYTKKAKQVLKYGKKYKPI